MIDVPACYFDTMLRRTSAVLGGPSGYQRVRSLSLQNPARGDMNNFLTYGITSIYAVML